MVYHHVGIHHLTPSQKSKLKRGGAVRMRLGSHHTLPLREDQIKKLQRGHKKGSAVTIELDPYQCNSLYGSGFFDSIKSAFSHPVTKQIVKALRPVATGLARSSLSSLGPMGQTAGNALIDVANQQAEAHGYGVKKHRKHYVHHDKRLMDGHIIEPEVLGLPVDRRRGRGFFDTLKKAASSDAAKAISRSLRPMATDYLRSKLPTEGILGTLGHTALDFANKEAEKRGYGVHKKRRGRPRKGGALIAAGY
jgi:hypothetical protein